MAAKCKCWLVHFGTHFSNELYSLAVYYIFINNRINSLKQQFLCARVHFKHQSMVVVVAFMHVLHCAPIVICAALCDLRDCDNVITHSLYCYLYSVHYSCVSLLLPHKLLRFFSFILFLKCISLILFN